MFQSTFVRSTLPGMMGENWKSLMFLGVALVLSAMVLFIMPELLVFLVATLIMWGGLLLVFAAWHVRKMERDGATHRVHVWRI